MYNCIVLNLNRRYELYIRSYVDKCPFHLFDTQRNRNITRSELAVDISTALRRWIKFPLTCSEVVDNIQYFRCDNPALLNEWKESILPFVVAAMLKNLVIDDVGHFIYTLIEELQEFRWCYPAKLPFHMCNPSRMVQKAHDLIERKVVHSSLPSHQEVQEQIKLLGQYAILSHCWEEEELSFRDIEKFTDPKVQAKKGFRKQVA